MMRWLQPIVCGVVALLLHAAAYAPAYADVTDPTRDKPLADSGQEARARAFMREIRCVVCQSQSIDESDAEIAAQLRNVIREQMAAGKSEDEIRDYLTARYGDFVLMKPPFKPATLILWVGPFALVAIGLVAGLTVLRRPTKSAPADLSESERQRVQRLLLEGDDPSRGGAS